MVNKDLRAHTGEQSWCVYTLNIKKKNTAWGRKMDRGGDF